MPGGRDSRRARGRDRRGKRDRGQRPVRRPDPPQLARRIVRVNQGKHVGRLNVVDVQQIGFRIGVADFVGRARRRLKRGALGVETEVPGAQLDHHRLRGAEGKGDQARALGAVLDLAHERKSRAILCRPLHLGDEVAALGKAGLILGIVDAPEHLRGHLAAGKAALKDADICHVSAPPSSRPRALASRGAGCCQTRRLWTDRPASCPRIAWPRPRQRRP